MTKKLHILTCNDIPDIVLAEDLKSGILLIRDAVYLLLNPKITTLKHSQIYALADDLQARGINKHPTITNLSIIDYLGFVDLIVKYEKTITWT